MPEVVACNLCGSTNHRLLYGSKDHRFRTDDAVWNLVRCRECGLGYLNPRPAREEIGRYYPSKFYKGRDADHAQRRYAREAQFVPGPIGDLLDIGTAQGDFLAFMRQRGWRVQGLEPSENAENPHGLPIQRARFPEEAAFPDASFDVVTAWAVFEHLHDPKRAFAEVARMLRPNGAFVLQVPNLDSIHSRLLQMEDIPRHLYFFNRRTLQRYGRENGLTMERFVHTTDLYGGSGRGVLRRALARATGHSNDEFFEMLRTPRAERLRRWPSIAVPWLLVAGIERALISDWLVRTARVSGQVVAVFRRAPASV